MCGGAIQRKVTQTGPQHADAFERVGIEDFTIKETDKLAFEVKLNETHLTIHPFSRQLKWVDLAFIGYTDAAEGGSIDGSSTRGYVLRMVPHRQSIH